MFYQTKAFFLPLLVMCGMYGQVQGDCCPDYYTAYYDYPIHIIEELGEEVTLDCRNSTPTPPSDAKPVSWMMPDLSRAEKNYSYVKYNVSDDGYFLTVYDVMQEDFGLYHCMMKYENESRWWMVKMGINTEGPYYEDLWEKYRLNTIIGLSCFFGFLALCLSIWLIWRFRWQSDEPDEPDLYIYTGKPDELDLENKPDICECEKGVANAAFSEPDDVPTKDVNSSPNGNLPVDYPESTEDVDVYTGPDDNDHEMTSF